jgi:MoaA/NifB/PqqE/SkfB family radical SAM enzyme
MTTERQQPAARDATGIPLRMLWCEVTGLCQLACRHCYAGSGPGGSHGTMTRDDWLAVIGQAADLGVPLIQFIGGEPTLHPDLPRLIDAAAAAGLQVEVFSNLVRVSPRLWRCFAGNPVTLATSWYSSDPGEHRSITGRPAHARTKANIAEAVRRGIPVRAGIIDVLDGQRTAQARAELQALGVTDIGGDRLRGIGRGGGSRDVAELCGNCGRGVAAISPDGEVWPCVMARWLCAGSVLEQPLASIIGGPRWRDLVAAIPSPATMCGPDRCNPQCSPHCYPNCSPRSHCNPNTRSSAPSVPAGTRAEK